MNLLLTQANCGILETQDFMKSVNQYTKRLLTNRENEISSLVKGIMNGLAATLEENPAIFSEILNRLTFKEAHQVYLSVANLVCVLHTHFLSSDEKQCLKNLNLKDANRIKSDLAFKASYLSLLPIKLVGEILIPYLEGGKDITRLVHTKLDKIYPFVSTLRTANEQLLCSDACELSASFKKNKNAQDFGAKLKKYGPKIISLNLGGRNARFCSRDQKFYPCDTLPISKNLNELIQFCPNIEELNLESTGDFNITLPFSQTHPKLTTMFLSYNNIDDTLLKNSIHHFSAITSLVGRNLRLSAIIFNLFLEIPHLTSLNLSESQFLDDLTWLTPLQNKLKRLILFQTNLSDAYIKRIARSTIFKYLEVFNIGNCIFNNETYKILALASCFPKLKKIGYSTLMIGYGERELFEIFKDKGVESITSHSKLIKMCREPGFK